MGCGSIIDGQREEDCTLNYYHQSRGHLSFRLRYIMILAITCNLSACAVAHSGPDGSVRVVGLADVQVTPAERSSGMTGNVVTIQTVGLMLSLMDTVADLAIGYYHGRVVLLRNCGPLQRGAASDVDTPRWRTGIRSGLRS